MAVCCCRKKKSNMLLQERRMLRCSTESKTFLLLACTIALASAGIARHPPRKNGACAL